MSTNAMPSCAACSATTFGGSACAGPQGVATKFQIQMPRLAEGLPPSAPASGATEASAPPGDASGDDEDASLPHPISSTTREARNMHACSMQEQDPAGRSETREVRDRLPGRIAQNLRNQPSSRASRRMGTHSNPPCSFSTTPGPGIACRGPVQSRTLLLLVSTLVVVGCGAESTPGMTSADAGADAAVASCPPGPTVAPPSAEAHPLLPDPTFAWLGQLRARVRTACVDTSNLPTHAALDDLVTGLLAEAGLASAPLGSCSCDFAIAFAATPPPLTGDAAAAWSAAGTNDERY